MTSSRRLIDSFGRVHDNLRISVTDRCNIRCFYCMPADDVTFMKRELILSFEEIERVTRIAVSLGVNKVRITGGEPLVRRDLHVLVEKLCGIDGVKDVGITTNGILLADHAQQLYDSGLRRINVSLDVLDAEKFKRITRREGFENVIEGIQKAQDVGFDPVKVNAISIRGLTEEQIVPLGEFARRTGVELRFIEFMPLDADNAWERKRVLFASEILEQLCEGVMPMIPVKEDDECTPTTLYQFEDGVGRVGFIPSVSSPFCQNCNRFRITADGKLRNCLFSLEETDVRDLLREGNSDEEIAQAILTCVAAKNEGHEINAESFIQPDRPMYSIGG